MKLTFGALIVGTALLSTWACDRSRLPLSPGAATVPFAASGVVYGSTSTGPVALEGATVLADSGAQAITGSDGAYAIRGQSATQTVHLTVRKDGYASVVVAVPASADIHTNFELESLTTGALSGVISETTLTGTAPAQGILVEILSCDQAVGNCHVSVEQRATTDKSGAFRLSGLYAGKDNFIWLSRNGLYYDDVPPAIGCDLCFRAVTIDAETRLDILLQTPPH